MRVALYARYSNDRQNERSIEDQFAVCRRHAAARGWTVVATFSDAAISGAAMANRPGILALLAAAAAGDFDRVLVEDTDRLARDREHDAHIFKRLTFARVIISTLTSDHVTAIESTFKGLMNELYLVNLSQKTSRGMRANAELGLATGSRLYGYRSEPGGVMAIVEAEAEVIRRIFDRYAAGDSAREIAAVLNLEGVPGPRGRQWNASTINGSRQRANGILNTELYAGVKVWNRMDVRKDPVTGARIPVMKPVAEWRRTPAPALRIVAEAAWDQARARKAAEGALRPHQLANRRRPGIFAGLLKCGRCGASYTTYNDGRLTCTGHRERGDAACTNRRVVRRAEIEERVLEGLRTRLLTPEAVAAYVRAYHAAWMAEAAQAVDRRAPLERRKGELHRSIERIVDAVCAGSASPAVLERLQVQEAEKAALEAQIAALDAQAEPRPITLHPGAASRYAAIVASIQANLAEISADPTDDAARALVDAVRALVTRIDIEPLSNARGADIAITLHGDLARFLEPPEQMGTRSRRLMVAGASFTQAPTLAGFVLRVA